MKKLILIILIAFSLSNCKTREKIITVYDTVVKENITIEQLRDTIITINSDSSVLQLYWECDSLGNVYISEINHLRKGKPQIIYREKVKYLEIVAKIDAERLKFILKDKIIKQYEKHKSTLINTIEVERKLTAWQSVIQFLGYVMFGCILVLLLFGFLKITKIAKLL